MIGHQAIGMANPVEAGTNPSERIQPGSPIVIGKKMASRLSPREVT
jgi:hypothetical protein